MNWDNINLNDSYESQQYFLDPYDFETLLLELQTNFKTEDLTEEEILKHAFKAIDNKVTEAKDILKLNIKNIISHEIKRRKKY